MLKPLTLKHRSEMTTGNSENGCLITKRKKKRWNRGEKRKKNVNIAKKKKKKEEKDENILIEKLIH